MLTPPPLLLLLPPLLMMMMLMMTMLMMTMMMMMMMIALPTRPRSFGYIRPHLLRPDTGVDEAVLDDCVQKGYVAALGVGMQGVFTLTPVITPLCFLHWGGAAIFAGAAQAHATTAIEAYEKAIASTASPVSAQSPPPPPPRPRPRPRPRPPSFVAHSATQLPLELLNSNWDLWKGS